MIPQVAIATSTHKLKLTLNGSLQNRFGNVEYSGSHITKGVCRGVCYFADYRVCGSGALSSELPAEKA